MCARAEEIPKAETAASNLQRKIPGIAETDYRLALDDVEKLIGYGYLSQIFVSNTGPIGEIELSFSPKEEMLSVSVRECLSNFV